MYLFTWNIKGRSAAWNDAVKHLALRAKRDHVVACIQEAPEPEFRTLPAGLSICESNETLALVTSNSLKPSNEGKHASGRFLYATLEAKSGSLKVVGLHGYDQINYTDDAERGGLASLLRGQIDAVVGQDERTVILGDFNAEPGDAEISSFACLYAVDQRFQPDASKRLAVGVDRSPLVVLPDTAASPGTLFISRGTRRRWGRVDFIALTADLVGRATCRTLNELEGDSLLGPRSDWPTVSGVSDHLPVCAELFFQ